MHPIATNRDALLRIAATTLAQLQGAPARSFLESSAAAADVTADDVGVKRDIVANALTAALDYARLEGELLEMAPTDSAEAAQDTPYVPSNQALALIQSAIEDYIPEQAMRAGKTLDAADPQWIPSAWEKLEALAGRKKKFIEHTSPTSFQHSLPDAAVVALFSDWGTGEATARRVMTEITRANPTHAIHLGDVYFTGTRKEVQEKFLDVIDAVGPLPAECRYLALNSNHEMFSGGEGYFGLTLPRFEQEASYFNLRNSHWQLLGLDSAYEDHGLQDPQDEWLTAQLQDTGPRNIVLMHHQLFSPFEQRAYNRQLHEKIEPFLPRVHACFWGHEHKAIVFGKHQGINARCIGHGALPIPVPYGRPQFRNVPIERIDERVAPGAHHNIHGFALLRFNGAELHVSYIDEFGTTWFEEHL
jgi:Calcineurin-like phosphoesterase